MRWQKEMHRRERDGESEGKEREGRYRETRREEQKREEREDTIKLNYINSQFVLFNINLRENTGRRWPLIYCSVSPSGLKLSEIELF